VQEFIRHLQGLYGNCHVISVCQPTVPVLAAVSLMASRGETTPLTMTMMGGPIDARKSPTAVNNLAMNKSYSWFENNVIYRVPTNFPGAGRRVYPGFLQHTGFVAMNPDRHLSSHYDYFKHLIAGDDTSAEAHRQFYDEYNAVLDMDADYYLDTIRWCSRSSRWSTAPGTSSAPKATSSACARGHPDHRLLTIEGELDDISGSGQTEAAHGLCYNVPKARQKHLEVKGAGHYGIFSGRRWRDSVYPQVRDFIASSTTGAARHGCSEARTGPRAARSRKKATARGGVTRSRAAARRPAADAVHALRLPGLRRLRRGHRVRRSGHQPCPPGGAEGVVRLAALTGRPVIPLNPANGVEGPRTVAVIDENWCIGCTLCLDACPTDAILGANKRMHTVIEPLLHRLRTVRAGLPGGLHPRHQALAQRSDRPGHRARQVRQRSPPARPRGADAQPARGAVEPEDGAVLRGLPAAVHRHHEAAGPAIPLARRDLRGARHLRDAGLCGRRNAGRALALAPRPQGAEPQLRGRHVAARSHARLLAPSGHLSGSALNSSSGA
jgi:NAD-dependent dihydropyrimidine dehydrogenase PreA subunit